jgi:DNA-binding transcriptional LysR family regulator
MEPSFILGQAIEAGRLVPILTDYRWPTLHAHAAYPRTRHLSQRVRAFVDFLAERFAGAPYWDRYLENHEDRADSRLPRGAARQGG